MDRLATRRDVVSGILLVVFSALYYLSARGLPTGTNEPGPGFLPKILAGLLAVLGTVILVRGLAIPTRRESKGETAGETGAERAPRQSLTWPVALAAASLLYVWGFTLVGFAPATLALSTLIVVSYSHGPGRGRDRKWQWEWLIVPLVTTALLYVIFAIGLGVPLPRGELWR